MKMTLDNPAVLEQKLEALEHHKKVLENQQARRLQLAAAAGGHQTPKPQLPASAAPTSHPQSTLRTLNNSANTPQVLNRPHNNGSSIYENHQMLYENLKHNENTDMYGRNGNGDRSGHMFDGCQHDAKNNSSLIYSNITHGSGNVSGSRNGNSATQDMANPYSNIAQGR